jgi:hypothetical protein
MVPTTDGLAHVVNNHARSIEAKQSSEDDIGFVEGI